MSDRGIDFSHYQGAIDWHAVKNAGYTFAIGKVTEGSTNTDPNWAANRNYALQAGMKVAGYHWVHPNNDVHASTARFLDNLQQTDGMVMPFLDVEHNGSLSGPTGPGGVSPQHIHQWIHDFADTYGKPFGIYTGTWFWNPYVEPAAGNCSECASRPLWLSRYADSVGAIPRPWNHATIWQHTDKGSVPGIGGNVDLDVFVTGTLQDLLTAGHSTGTTTQPPQGDWFDMASKADLKAVVKEVLDDEREAYAKRTTAWVLKNGLAGLIASEKSFHNEYHDSRMTQGSKITDLVQDVDDLKAALAKLADHFGVK